MEPAFEVDRVLERYSGFLLENVFSRCSASSVLLRAFPVVPFASTKQRNRMSTGGGRGGERERERERERKREKRATRDQLRMLIAKIAIHRLERHPTRRTKCIRSYETLHEHDRIMSLAMARSSYRILGSMCLSPIRCRVGSLQTGVSSVIKFIRHRDTRYRAPGVIQYSK